MRISKKARRREKRRAFRSLFSEIGGGAMLGTFMGLMAAPFLPVSALVTILVMGLVGVILGAAMHLNRP